MREPMKTIVGAALAGLALCLWAMAGCDPTTVGDDAASSEASCFDDLSAAPQCQPCSQTETMGTCTPSRCARSSDGRLCCVQ